MQASKYKLSLVSAIATATLSSVPQLSVSASFVTSSSTHSRQLLPFSSSPSPSSPSSFVVGSARSVVHGNVNIHQRQSQSQSQSRANLSCFSSNRKPTLSFHPLMTSSTNLAETNLDASLSTSSSSPGPGPGPGLSSRIYETLDPCVVLMKQLISQYNHLWQDKGGIQSLAQGIVYWTPPPTSFENIAHAAQGALDSPTQTDIHMYGPEVGLPELVTKLEQKLKHQNGLDNVNVMVTAGANQAYVNCVLTLLEEKSDKGIIFAPYYFNHVMAMQMSRGDASILIGPTQDVSGMPDLEWLTKTLEEQQQEGNHIKMVTIVNPGNPTGVSIPRELLNQIVEICEKHKVWLIIDNTYEHFDHVGANAPPSLEISDSDGNGDGERNVIPFECSKSDHVIHIFSFSKGYSMAGFRVGYLTVSKSGCGPEMFQQMLKVCVYAYMYMYKYVNIARKKYCVSRDFHFRPL